MKQSQDIHKILQEKINHFQEIERVKPKLIILSEIYLVILQSIDREMNYLEYMGIPVHSTVRRNIIEIF